MAFLTDEQLRQLETEGCLCIADYLSPGEVAALLAHTHKLIDELDIASHPMTKFTTGTSDEEHVGDAYFLDSSDKVSFFLEPGAFDKDENLIKEKHLAINKIGHGLHIVDDAFKKVTINEKTVEIARQLHFTDPRVLQSMVICKQPEIGGEVPSHQDGVFLYTEPQTAIGFWIALEDCNEVNGCLSYLPGSHKNSPITKRFVRRATGGTGFLQLSEEKDYENVEENYVKVPCKKGSLVLIHNSVLHRSNKNLSDNSRYAYAFHVIDGTAKYDELNWLQIPSTGGTDFTKLEL
jgi:hypothetical protein